MKSLITYIFGALSGAFALFIFLSMPAREAAPALKPSVAVAPAIIAAPVVAVPDPAPSDKTGELPPVILQPPVTPLPASSADTAALNVQIPPFAPALPVAGVLTVGADMSPSDKLLIPVEGIKASQLRDTFTQARGADRIHEAIDIMAPTGTKVFAVADGKVVKLFNSKYGGLTVYQFDKAEKFSYYYAHLDQYAPGYSEGTVLRRGDLIGYVGSTGNANPSAPHLHFAIFELTPEKQWWKGRPINPYPLFQE